MKLMSKISPSTYVNDANKLEADLYDTNFIKIVHLDKITVFMSCSQFQLTNKQTSKES